MEKELVMPVRRIPLGPPAEHDAAIVRARRFLVELEERRFAVAQAERGCSQEAIAEALGTSQATVSRWLADAVAQPRALAVGVEELLARRVAGEISGAALVAEVAKLSLTYVNPDKRPEAPWARLRDAHRRGWVSDEETRQIARHAAERMVKRVNHHMALESQPVSNASADTAVEETTERLLATL